MPSNLTVTEKKLAIYNRFSAHWPCTCSIRKLPTETMPIGIGKNCFHSTSFKADTVLVALQLITPLTTFHRSVQEALLQRSTQVWESTQHGCQARARQLTEKSPAYRQRLFFLIASSSHQRYRGRVILKGTSRQQCYAIRSFFQWDPGGTGNDA